MSIPTPPNGMVSNTELILRKILGEDVTPLPPNSRVEFYLIQVEEYIERLATGATRPIGETTTPLSDGATTNPITIDGDEYTAQINDLVFYGNKEFLFTANGWREVGDLTNITASVVGMGSWTPGSATTHSTPAGTDSVLEALQKIDNNQRNDENNISLLEQMNGAKNKLNFSEAVVKATRCTATNKTSKSVDLSTDTIWAFYNYAVTLPSGDYVAMITVENYSTTSEIDSRFCVFKTDSATQGVGTTAYFHANGTYVSTFTADGTSTYYPTIYLNPSDTAADISLKATNLMIIPKSAYDAGFTDYQPYALSNAELTEKEQQNEADISAEQAKTTGMSEGGSNYITVGGIRVYVSATAPTGARTGDLWIGG